MTLAVKSEDGADGQPGELTAAPRLLPGSPDRPAQRDLARLAAALLSLAPDGASPDLELRVLHELLTDGTPAVHPQFTRRSYFRRMLRLLWASPALGPEQPKVGPILRLGTLHSRLAALAFTGVFDVATVRSVLGHRRGRSSSTGLEDYYVEHLLSGGRPRTMGDLAIDTRTPYPSRCLALAGLIVGAAQRAGSIPRQLVDLVVDIDRDERSTNVLDVTSRATLHRAYAYVPYLDGAIRESYDMVCKEIEALRTPDLTSALRDASVFPFHETAATISCELGLLDLAAEHVRAMSAIDPSHPRSLRTAARLAEHEGNQCRATELALYASQNEPLARVKYCSVALALSERHSCQRCRRKVIEMTRTEIARVVVVVSD